MVHTSGNPESRHKGSLQKKIPTFIEEEFQETSKKHQKEIDEIFDKYRNKEHWKEPFEAKNLSSNEAELLMEAIGNSHGTSAILKDDESHPGKYIVKSKGYYEIYGD